MSASGMLAAALRASFQGPAWQGTALLGSLRGITPAEALWRPGPRRRCIHEHVLHAAYWKYAVRRRLAPGDDSPSGLSPANWPSVPGAPDVKAWREATAILRREQAKLERTVAGIKRGWGDIPPGGRKWTRAQLVYGVTAHDAYHTGQIQLLKRLARG